MTTTSSLPCFHIRRRLGFLLLFALALTVPVGYSTETETRTMSPAGGVQFGSKSIRTKKDYGSLVFTLDNDIQGSMGEIFNFGEGYISPPFFLDHAQAVEGNTSSFATHFRASTTSSEVLGTYKISTTLLPDGLVRVNAVAKMDESKRLESRYLTISLPTFMTFKGRLIQGGESRDFDAATAVTFSGSELKDATLEFFPDDKKITFSVLLENCSSVTINKSSVQLHADDEGVLSYLVDLRTQPDIVGKTEVLPNGIDVWSGDRLPIPDYSTSKNLILNPSFEAGFRYWTFRTFSDYAMPLEYDETMVIDDEVAHSGTNSLRLRAMKTSLPFGTFGLPVVPDEKYTVSFWAKASQGKPGSLYLDARSGDSSEVKGFPTDVFDINDEWQRYQFSFTVQHQFVSLYFRPTGNPNMDSFIWVDDVQVESGAMAAFSAPPILTQLLSSARGNFLEFDQKPDFKLALHVPPSSKGSVSLSVQDFFFNVIYAGDYEFQANEAGEAVIALEDLDKKISGSGLRGIFEVSAAILIDGSKEPFRDYYRFSIMNFLKNKHRNSHIFDITYAWSLQAGGPEMERFVEHERNVGFGSYSYSFLSFGNDLDLALDKERADLMTKYGFVSTGRIIATAHAGNGQISERNGEMKITNIKEMINPTPEQLAEVEEICRVKAELRPWNPIWFFSAESNPGMMPLSGHLEAFSKFLIATNKGVKAGNPEAKVLIEGGPWNIAPDSGLKWVEEYIQTTRKLAPDVKFDGAAGHTYGNFPEPLDENVEAFIAMLDRNDCKDWPIYLNEGGGYCIMSIPQLGITPYVWNSGNRWYIGALSYGIGRAERISSAFSARAWLVALKHQSRVESMNDFFTPNRYLDIDFTARAYNKIPNTLGRILGDANFYKDVKFAPYTRCYVFRQDSDGAPIAAIWSYKETVDRWKEEPTLVKFDFGSLAPIFIDLMENEVSFPQDADGRTIIPMAPFPIFIKGAPGTEEQLCAAIANSEPLNLSNSDVDNLVKISAFPSAGGKAIMEFENNLPRAFSEDAIVSLNGEKFADTLELAAHEESTKSLEIPGAPFDTNRLLDFDFAFQVGDGTPKKIVGTYLLMPQASSVPMVIDGKWDDWKDISPIDLGSNLSLRTFAEEEKLYFAIEIKNTDLAPAEAFAGIGFYFDPFERTNDWTTPKNPKGDLGIYELVKDPEGTLGAFCHIVQGTQAGSSSSVLFQGKVQPRFEVRTGKTPDGIFVECVVPQILLSPLKITAKSRFGLNLSFPLRNGEIKTLAPMPDYKSPADPGDLNLIMVIIGTESKSELPNQ